MANNNILLVLLVVAVALALYYFVFDQKLGGACKWCPQCGKKTADGKCPDCPSCLVTRQDAMQALQQMAKSCTHRLRGVVREDMSSASEVSQFMTGGTNRLTIITNVDPEDFVAMIQSGQQPVLSQLKAVAMSSSIVQGDKNYLVMSVNGGQMSPIGTSTNKFVDAFKHLETAARQQLGADSNNLVFYVDEDIPCPDDDGLTPIDEEGMVGGGGGR
jgi:hypothetical protein